MMGYASLSQTDSGLHMRQFARAFVVSSASSNAPSDRILFINTDTGTFLHPLSTCLST